MSKLFISYRREDAAGYAISLHDRLADRFGADQLFMDVDNIEPGEDFAEVINAKVSACEILLVLIGRDWLTCKDESGQRRIENHDDFVRLEVMAALERKIRVIPVLVAGAMPPKPGELPTELTPLCRLNAMALTHESFRQDVNRLIESIEKVIRPSGSSVRKPPTPTGSSRTAATASAAREKDVVRSDPSHGSTHAVAPSSRPVQKTRAEAIRLGKERVFRGHGKPVKTVAFSPDSSLLASAGGGSWLGGGDTAIRLWRVSDGRLLRELPGHEDTVGKVVFSPDGERLASCCSKSIHLWRTSDGKQLRTLTGGEYDGGDSLAFSLDGTRLLCWIDDPEDEQALTYDLWSVPDGKHLGSYSHRRLPRKADYRWERVSPDRKMTARAELVRIEEEYWAIIVKRTADGATLVELKDKSTGTMSEWNFSPDGRLVAAAYLDNKIRLWRVTNGKQLAKIDLPETPNSVALSVDGQWLAAGCEDKCVRLWPLLESSSV